MPQSYSTKTQAIPNCAVRKTRSASTHHDPGAELAVWGEQVDVLAAYKVLRHADDGRLQTGVPMVVRSARADDALEYAHLKEKRCS
jgi:hypothetical protein